MATRMAPIVVTVLVAALAGCGNKKPKGPACLGDSDCKDGTVCINKECKACSKDDQCTSGKCLAGACQRAKKCTKDEDCADDEDCINGVCLNPSKPPDVAGPCSLSTVYFAFDDSSIQSSERTRLDSNGNCLEKNGQRSVYLVGHTDSSGTDEYNIALSERRGRSVAEYLARLGVNPSKMQVVPKGETEITGQGDDKDRRVEFQWR